MNASITREKLLFSNRKQECELFCEILRRKSALRGLVIHSGGQGGLGKSTLLKMFENQCQAPDLSMSTTALYFNAERLVQWQTILDKTVQAVGKKHFQNYILLRNTYNVKAKSAPRPPSIDTRATSIHYETHIYGPVYGPTTTGSGDIDISKPDPFLSGVGESSASAPSFETPPNPKETRMHLTRGFLRALNDIPEPFQVVWLVDTAEMLDDVTKAWLVEMFWQLAEGATERLILVVAGREMLRYEPHWTGKIAQMPIVHFSEDTVVDILQEIWPDYDASLLRMTASGLVDRSDGKPLEVIVEIMRHIGL